MQGKLIIFFDSRPQRKKEVRLFFFEVTCRYVQEKNQLLLQVSFFLGGAASDVEGIHLKRIDGACL